MATYRSAAQLLKAQQREMEGFVGTRLQAFDRLAQLALQDARELTSGASPSGAARVSLLRQLGHPFGREAGGARRAVDRARLRRAKLRGTLPLRPVGQISGALYAGWRLDRVNGSGRTGLVRRYELRNRAAHAAFALAPAGTVRTVARGVAGQRERGQPDGEIVRRYRARSEGLRRNPALQVLART